MVAVWIGLVVGGYSLAGKLDSVTRDGQADYLPASAQSTKVLQAEAALPGGENGLLVVVSERPEGLQPGDREAVVRGHADLAERFGANADVPPEIVESDDGTVLMYSLSLEGDAAAEEAGATADARQLLVDHPAGLNVYVTGPTALGADMDEVFDAVDSRLLLVTAAVVALLLILTYRSPLLWLVPLASVGVAAISSMGIVYALTQVFDRGKNHRQPVCVIANAFTSRLSRLLDIMFLIGAGLY